MMAFVLVLSAVVEAAMFDSSSTPSQMNSRPYSIANPPANGSPFRGFRGEYFEMYGSNITTRFGDVDWHFDSVSLPNDIISRFDGKTMVITGYEVNIVRTDPNTGMEEEISALEQYNHHYTGFMTGKAVRESPQSPSIPSVMGSHGTPVPYFEPSSTRITQSCNMTGIWLNPSNNVKVNITALPSGGYTASCIGPVGWKEAKISVSPPNALDPQGSASMTVVDDPRASTTGRFFTFPGVSDSPPCSQISWKDTNIWVLEPYADEAKSKTTIPTIQVFSEGNGNEHRVSFKGYPLGYGLLIDSPTTFKNGPMIINTNKRLTDDKSPGGIGGPSPRGSLAPPNADYQGILECPCTTRKIKVLDGYKVVPEGNCGTDITTATECEHAAELSGIPVNTATIINSSVAPSACSAAVHSDGSWMLTFNVNDKSSVRCGDESLPSAMWMASGSVGDVGFAMTVDRSTNNVTVTMTCKANGFWCGVGLNATDMNQAYALVVDGTGKLSEHRLGDHAAGSVLASTARIISSSQHGSFNTIVIQLPLTGNNFDFSKLSRGSLPLISAIGNTVEFAHHVSHATGLVALAAVNTSSCVCRDPMSNSGTIDGNRFNPGVCAPFPKSELLTTHNDICNISTYGGGLYCCHDKTVLLDADQPQPTPTDTWRMKYRFYFEDYTNQTNTFRVWWSTEATNNEYDVPKSTANCLDASTPVEDCIHEIKSEFTGLDLVSGPSACMVNGDKSACADVNRIATEYGGYYQLTYAAFHCHAPACMSGELWNRDTGELICRNEPLYGTGASPSNETGYVVGIPPCVWGSKEEGLQPFPIIHLTSNLTSIKRANSTNGHWGVMALWQARASYLPSKLR